MSHDIADDESHYAWVIDDDLINRREDDEVVVKEDTKGPHNAPEILLDGLADGQGAEFLLSDDDAIPYFKGRLMWHPLDDQIEELADIGYAPLKDLGHSYGCTMIHYLDAYRNWVQLGFNTTRFVQPLELDR